jgi:hypothetical protein
MWGSSFADLAKVAADLQEQATAATASISVRYPYLFYMYPHSLVTSGIVCLAT